MLDLGECFSVRTSLDVNTAKIIDKGNDLAEQNRFNDQRSDFRHCNMVDLGAHGIGRKVARNHAFPMV